MALQKLKALHAHLEAAQLIESEKLDSWAEDGEMIYSQEDQGQGLIICRFKYDAVIVLEDFTKDPDLLIAQVCTWFVEFDSEREDQQLSPPSIDIDLIDDLSAIIEIRAQFQEDIGIKEDVAGAVSLYGKKYSLSDLGQDVAKTVGVGNDETAPTDATYTRPD